MASQFSRDLIKKVDPILRVPFVVLVDSFISSLDFNNVYSIIQTLPGLFVVIPLVFVGHENLTFIYSYYICLKVILTIIFFTVGDHFPVVLKLIMDIDSELLLVSYGLWCSLILLNVLGRTELRGYQTKQLLLVMPFASSILLGNYKYSWIFGFLLHVAGEISGAHNYLERSFFDTINLFRHGGIINTIFYYYKTRKISTVLKIFWLLALSRKSLLNRNAQFSLQWFLTSVGASCNSKLRLFAMSLCLPEASYFVLWASRGFLNWTMNHTAEDLESCDLSKALAFYIIASLNRVTNLEIIQRTFFLTLLMFISFSFILESAVKQTNEALTSLSISPESRISAHVRALIMMFFLLCIMFYTCCKFCTLFPLHLWQLVIISSNIVTAVQALSSLAVYALFVYDTKMSTNLKDLDDWVYYITAMTNSLEFLSALFSLSVGLWNVTRGNWTIVGLLVIILHTYYNLWLKAQDAWKVFMNRRSAAKKLNCLVNATKEELEKRQDLCPICFESITEAKITQCGHYFHAHCLRKWLYIQTSCPLCHQDVLITKVKED